MNKYLTLSLLMASFVAVNAIAQEAGQVEYDAKGREIIRLPSQSVSQLQPGIFAGLKAKERYTQRANISETRRLQRQQLQEAQQRGVGIQERGVGLQEGK